MAGEWREVSLGEVVDIQTGKLDSNQADQDGAYPFFTCAPEPLRINRFAFECDAVLLAGNNANGIFHVNRYAGRFNAYQRTYVITPSQGTKIETGFLYYVLHTLTQRLEEYSQGTATKFLTMRILSELPISAPPLFEQRAIAHILGTLDDKIELNRRMNETLEAMARALFQSWFIDFDPVRRNATRKQNQPSPWPSPKGRGRDDEEKFRQPSPRPSPSGRGRDEEGEIRQSLSRRSSSGRGSQGEGAAGVHYRGGYDFAGLVERARELRKKQTPAETIFWEMVRDRQFLGLKFRRQHQLGDYIADFYCPEHKLVIEFDGSVHATTRKRDHKRDAWMEAQGFKVLRFKNDQLFDAPESVLAAMAQAVHQEDAFPLPVGEGQGEAFPLPARKGLGGAFPLPLGEGEGEGSVEELDRLFPDSFQDSELGEIPKGWKVATIGEHMVNFDSQRIPVSGAVRAKRQGPYPYHGAAGVMDHVDDYLFDGIYLLVGEDGSVVHDSGLAVTQYVWGKILVNNHAHVLQGRGAVSTEQLCMYFRFEPVTPYVTGAVQPKLSQGRMNMMPFTFGGDDVCRAFAEAVQPWFSRVRAATDESRTLASLRDALLPKLISGELRVKDMKEFIGRTV